MAAADAKTLTLFDPSDSHPWCDTRFNNEIFIRIIDAVSCLDHILCIQGKNPELDVHLFFPHAQIEHIYSRPQDYGNTIKYIYCNDGSLIDSTKRTYGRRFAHKIFTVNGLEFEISHVVIALLHALAKQAPEESPERNRFVLAAIGEIDMLQHNLEQMRTAQLGEQAIELH